MRTFTSLDLTRLLVFITILYTQINQVGASQHTFATVSPNGSSTIKSSTTASGEILVIGTFDGPTLEIGSFTLNKIGNTDLFIAKYSGNGDVLWAKNFGGPGTTMTAGDIDRRSGLGSYVTGSYSGGEVTTLTDGKVSSAISC